MQRMNRCSLVSTAWRDGGIALNRGLLDLDCCLNQTRTNWWDTNFLSQMWCVVLKHSFIAVLWFWFKWFDTHWVWFDLRFWFFFLIQWSFQTIGLQVNIIIQYSKPAIIKRTMNSLCYIHTRRILRSMQPAYARRRRTLRRRQRAVRRWRAYASSIQLQAVNQFSLHNLCTSWRWRRTAWQLL